MTYNWQLSQWPHFTYKLEDIQPSILAFAQETSEVNGIVQTVPDELMQATILQLMLSEAVKTSEIEGEYISREDVLSSIRNNLGINKVPATVKDRRASGVARLMIEIRQHYSKPLSQKMLLTWHKTLMGNADHINPGHWRQGTAPMQVISGRYGNETVHYEAPPSAEVPELMKQFVKWYNLCTFPLSGNIAKAVLKSSIAHLYFESIHPFEDGNGRIGRALAEKALSESLGRPVVLSLSTILERNKKAYYEALKQAQRTLEITEWIHYFTSVLLEAQTEAKSIIRFTMKKAQFFDRFKNQLNERQLKVVRKMLDKGPGGFEGGMTAKKYMSITKTSKATATRDLQQLFASGVFISAGGGRSVNYQLNMT